MKSIQFYLIIIVFMFISYLDFHYNLNGYLLISFDLFFIFYYTDRKLRPICIINFNFFYYIFFVFCLYTFYFLITSLIFINNELIKSELNNFLIIKALFIYPILEELIFRKYLLVSLNYKNSQLKSILILSFGFTLIHYLTDSSLFYVFLLSIFLSWTYLKTRNIFLCIVLHFFNNLLTFTDIIVILSKFKLVICIILCVVLLLLIIYSLHNILNDKINEFNNNEK